MRCWRLLMLWPSVEPPTPLPHLDGTSTGARGDWMSNYFLQSRQRPLSDFLPSTVKNPNISRHHFQDDLGNIYIYFEK